MIGDLLTRITRLEELLENQSLLNLQTQIESLRQDTNKLRGQVEVLTNENELTQKRQRDFYIDLDGRLRRVEQPDPPAISASPPLSGIAGSETEASPPVAEVNAHSKAEVSENDAYEAAYEVFKSGNYQSAITKLQAFLANHPSSRLAPSALYWIGNSHYALRDFSNAVITQRNLIKTYPDSSKAPDALLNIASSQRETNKVITSKKTLEDLIARYPSSDAADKARQRLINRK